MYFTLSPRLTRWLAADVWKVRLTFWLGAVAVGSAAALFAMLASRAGLAFRDLLHVAPWAPLLLTPLGLMLIVWITRRYFPGAEGSGIPQTIAMLETQNEHLRREVLSIRMALAKIGLTLLALLCGAPVGREGPTVHVGASILYSIGRKVRFPREHLERGLILAGSAAGLAAAFNTPLAGIVFAIEELSKSLEERTSGIILTAVVLAGVTAIGILGNYSYFGMSHATLDLRGAAIGTLVCGVAGGILGGLYSHALLWGSRRLGRVRRSYPLRFSGICGLTIAALGLLSHGDAFGAGYNHAKGILNGHITSGLLFPLYKLAASVASYWSGIPGGIFAPALATGAGLGLTLTHLALPLPVSAAAILAMAGYFAGVVQAPITSFVIVMEMTSDHVIVLPLIATAFIGSTISRMITPVPLYRALAKDFLAGRPMTEGPASPVDAGTTP